MSRLGSLAISLPTAVLLSLGAAACSKSATNPDKVASPPAGGAGDTIAVPKGTGGPSMQPAAEPVAKGASDDDRFKLKALEGKLAIEPPADAKAGGEALARVIVTPGNGFHVNTEYPTKLTLTAPDGVKLAKGEFTAGGGSKAKGDAESLEEQMLAFAVKLTPAASGTYTVTGTLKFAVCDRDQCLPKKEAITIAVAAK